MKKVLIIDASCRNGLTAEAAMQINNLISEITTVDLVKLRKYDIMRCKGCCNCLSIGSSSCPLKDDDVKIIAEKLEQADGVIFVVPNYSLSVPGILKDLFDRLAYIFHRPRLFGRICLPIIVQGVYGGKNVAKYINEVMEFWGMNVVKGAVLTGGIYPKKALSNNVIEKNNLLTKKAVESFLKVLHHDKARSPSLFRLMIFRITRTSMKYFDEVLEPDKKYFETNGWFYSDYYYEVKLNPFKKVIGKYFDNMIKKWLIKSKVHSEVRS